MDVEAMIERGRKMGVKPPRHTVELTSGRPKKAWGMTRRGSLLVGDVVASEGAVRDRRQEQYAHNIGLLIGDDPEWKVFARPETVYAFSASNVKA